MFLQDDIRVVYAAEELASPCCTGGSGSVIINGTEFSVDAGQCYILLPGDTVIHTSNREHPRQGYWCALDGVSVGIHIENAGITSQAPFLPTTLFKPICDLTKHLTQLWSCRDAGSHLRQTACAYGLLGVMLQNKPSAEKSSLIDIAVGFMQTHYHEPLSVGGLAEHVGLERSHFSELFKEKTGSSPYQYLTKLRIQKACQLLSQGHNITDTSYLVGMEPHNFGRVFKKEVGNTPRDYLRILKQSKNQVAAHSMHIKEPQ